MSGKRKKASTSVLKPNSQRTGKVNPIHKAGHGKSGAASQNASRTQLEARRDTQQANERRKASGPDMPLAKRLFTSKGFAASELEGALQDRCKVMPVGKPFLPGVSGNPNGRPRTNDIKAIVREFSAEEDPKTGKTLLRQWLEIASRRARQGSPKHLELILAYGWGRPLQAQLNVNADLPSDDEAVQEVEQALQEMRAENGKPTVQ